MKFKNSNLYYYIALTILSMSFACLSKKSLAQTYIPVTNYHNGISIEMQGTEGEDYIFDRYYFEPLVNDCGLCYIKSDVKINLFHNENDSRVDNSLAPCINNEIRYKVDRDWQTGYYWAGDNGVPFEDFSVERFNYTGANFYPLFEGAISFDEMEYETDVPVVGTTGFVPGVDPTDRKNYYNRGLLDQAGNEYHYLTYADDDDQAPEWKNLEMSASDGKSMLFCVNPKTPAIWLSAASSTAQYYTTPAKVYWVPKIHEQTSYVTDDVEINLKNIMNTNTVYYRIDGGSYQAYSGAINSNTLSDGEHTLEFYYNASDVQTRKIVKNPEHPSKNDVYVDGQEHGYLLWKNDAEFLRAKERIKTGIWSKVSDYTDYPWSTYKEQAVTPYLDDPGNEGVRNKGGGSNLGSALAGMLEDGANRIPYFKAAKRVLLNNKRMHIENIGWEYNHSADPNPSHELTYRGYYDDRMLFGNAFAYDLLVAHFRSDQHTDGITPIEDYRLRDMLAITNHETMLYYGGYKNWQSPFADPTPEDEMWSTAHQNAAICAALAMPSYNTPYYGTCGFDGTPATHQWAPYPDYPRSWKDVYMDVVDKDDPKQVAMLHDFPNQSSMYNWYDGEAGEGLIGENGNWLVRGAYSSTSLMGHGFEIFYNVMKRKFNITYENLDSFMVRSAEGELYSYYDDAYSGNPRRLMANEYFPEMAPRVITARDEDMRAFYLTKPYFYFFHNPDWEDIAYCNSTTPPTVPEMLTGTSTDKTVTLTWFPANHDDCTVVGYKIKRDGEEIALTKTFTYTDSGLSSSTDYNYEIAAIIHSGVSSDYCPQVTVTTKADKTPPTIKSVSDTDNPTTTTVLFSEPMDKVSAETLTNYSIDEDIAIASAKLLDDNKSVELTFSAVDGSSNIISINNVKDVYDNSIEANTNAIFSYTGRNIGSNVATGGSVTASSEPDGNYPATNLIDETIGDESRWIANGYPQTIEIDLEDDYKLTWIELFAYQNVAYQYIIEGKSEEDSNYSTLIDNSANDKELSVFSHEETSVVRHLKITISGKNGGTGDETGIVEVKAFGNLYFPVTNISLSKSNADIHIEEKLYLYATIAPSNATMKDITWTSSNEDVAIVDANGIVIGQSAGQTTIRAISDDNGVEGTCVVDVDALTLSYALEEFAGTGITNPLDDYEGWDSSSPIVFSSDVSYPGRCKVDNGDHPSAGYTGASGESNIEINGGYSGASTVFISGINTEKLLSPTLSLAHRYPANSYTVEASSDGTEWVALTHESSEGGDDSWGRVIYSGIPSVPNLKIKIVNPTRKPMYVDDIIISGVLFEGIVLGITMVEPEAALFEGEKIILATELFPANVTNKKIHWTSDKTSIATVDGNGLVTAIAEGTATITATTDDGGFTATCELSVYKPTSAIPVSDVRISPEVSSVFVGGKVALTESVLPIIATNKSVEWSTNLEAIATVDGNGLVTAVDAGEAVITVTTDDGNKTASANISVKPLVAGNDNLALNQPTTTSSTETADRIGDKACDGNSGTRWASVHSDPQWIYVDLGNAYEITKIVLKWENAYGSAYEIQVSDNATDWNSIFTTTTADGGTDEITGLSDIGRYVRMYGTSRGTNYGYSLYEFEVYGNSVLTIVDVEEVSLNKNILNMGEGEKSQLEAIISPANSTITKVEWTSNDPSVARVDEFGVVSALKNGNATITATSVDGGFDASCTVSVGNSVIRVSGVNLSSTEESILINSTVDLDETIAPENAANKNVTWKSSDSNIATVDADGVVKAISKGTANITVTSDDGDYKAICIVTVVKEIIDVTGITLSNATLDLFVNETSELEATVSPANATNKKVNWTTSDNTIATVNNGVATGVKAGTCTITATTVDGNYKKTCEVTVDDITGIAGEFETNSPEVIVYPNPVTESYFTVDMNGYNTDEELNLKIYDVTGKMVYSLNNINTHQTKIPCNLSKGVYIINIDNGSFVKQEKLIVR